MNFNNFFSLNEINIGSSSINSLNYLLNPCLNNEQIDHSPIIFFINSIAFELMTSAS